MARIAIARILAALAATAVVIAADGWRTALLALVASGSLAATRIRCARHVAVGLLVAVAVLVGTGHAISGDERPAQSKRGGGEPGVAQRR